MRAQPSINISAGDAQQIIFRYSPYSINDAFALAHQLQLQNNHTDSSELYELILEKLPSHLASLNNLGLINFQREDIDEAIALYRRALQQKPDYTSALHNMGDALVSKGKLDKAIEMFLKALSYNANLPNTIYSLTHARKYGSTDHEDVRRIKKLLDNSAIANKEKLYFSLGKIYDDCEQYDSAFEFYREGNKICNGNISYNIETSTQEINGYISVFSKDFLRRSFSGVSQSQQPLFIIGMPRSGTTLVANILSNHPEIEAAGELVTLMESALMMQSLTGSNVSYPYAAMHLDENLIGQLADNYQQQLRRRVDSSATYIIDKHPLNFWHLGFISMMFPKARIIHCTRNPLDTCLSNYFQNFSLQYKYSFDLDNIAHYYSLYSKTMAHWREVLPMEMLEISYEDTVTNTEMTARKMLDFLGLEWNENCLSPHRNPRSVRTSSWWQVRQPIYSQSINRWRNYEKHLGPLNKIAQQA